MTGRSDSLRVEQCPTVEDFQAVAGAFLAQRPAEHGLIADILARTAAPSNLAGPPSFHLFVARKGEKVQGGAVYALPRTVFLTVMHWSAAMALAVELSRRSLLVPSLIGPQSAVDSFASAWTAATGKTFRERLELVLYEARVALPIESAPGQLRPATIADIPRVVAWQEAFITETRVSDNLAHVRTRVLEQLEAGRLYVWDNNGILATVAHSARRLGGARLYSVYTPPQERSKGFATAMTAALTDRLLRTSYERCILFADAANPASNHIYTKVGYRDLGRWRELTQD